ncbi:hypothetical protein CW751_06885 [Brumimicrobium salinarum]|uniref:Uncharacterized protein n=1 Tax=Brumimicrobium salinarum TaxID=2058658 RepID=A0A2I0R2U7_9FLAO|nr:hypothetical protein [Brumimicrobium salinarum]PKR80889.1 hypothetical protein CW751_06885 [Brumimicrobium salinarum]
MLNAIFRKKLSDQQLATIFINGLLNVIENGFVEVKSIIEDDPVFVKSPDLSKAPDGHFTMIVIVGNVMDLKNHFSSKQQIAIEPLIFKGLAESFGMTLPEFKKYFNDYAAFMKRANHPSKVTLYSMSKAMFFKYKLNAYQDDYFKSLNTPNPLFLKRLDEVLANFIWNWEAFFKRYKIHK